MVTFTQKSVIGRAMPKAIPNDARAVLNDPQTISKHFSPLVNIHKRNHVYNYF